MLTCKVEDHEEVDGMPMSKCLTHGLIYPKLSESGGATCPVGYISDIERRFNDTRLEVDAALRGQRMRHNAVVDRISKALFNLSEKLDGEYLLNTPCDDDD